MILRISFFFFLFTVIYSIPQGPTPIEPGRLYMCQKPHTRLFPFGHPLSFVLFNVYYHDSDLQNMGVFLFSFGPAGL